MYIGISGHAIERKETPIEQQLVATSIRQVRRGTRRGHISGFVYVLFVVSTKSHDPAPVALSRRGQ